ncbi:Usp family protein [Nocardia asteroides NBRC 15531]|uniref:Usp family protein n=1 Tax=Nocardia asteroides NBRC 15531 TaxID=1110697 RepID=U5EMV5_NOCAS|nr:Usp family protein [Nocardia asteroides NBRC 15531]
MTTLRDRPIIAGIDGSDRALSALAWPTPVSVLVKRSHSARLLVLGTRRMDAFDRAVLGSVSAVLVRRAGCPVVVVTAAPTPARSQPILVGVDGSPASVRAVDIAVEEAAARDATWSPAGVDTDRRTRVRAHGSTESPGRPLGEPGRLCRDISPGQGSPDRRRRRPGRENSRRIRRSVVDRRRQPGARRIRAGFGVSCGARRGDRASARRASPPRRATTFTQLRAISIPGS